MGWNTNLSQKILVFITILFISLYLIFPSRLYSLEWIFAAIFILILIITLINTFTKKRMSISERRFLYYLFIFSLFTRLITMFVLLWISYSTWDMVYYVGAKDEMVYHRLANEGREIWETFSFNEAIDHIIINYKNSISDSGFSSILMIILHITGNYPILLKILLCIFGSIAVLRGYKLASLLLDKSTARLAALFLMLYPISWFYSSVILKEGFMVLIITEILIQTVKLQRNFKLRSLLGTMVLIILMFFFRSAASILLAIVVGVSLFIQFKRKHLVRNILIGSLIIIAYVYFLKSTGKYDDYYELYTDIDQFTEERLVSMERINPFVAVAGTPVFTVLAFVSPFPSVVEVPVRDNLSHNEYYYHVAGNIFWIVLAFFSIYGVYYAIRYNRLMMAPLWTFIIGYQLVLLKAMMFTSVRYSYPAKPFLLIMAAYGISQLIRKKWYHIYLGFALIMILAWNYVRLKGRGL